MTDTSSLRLPVTDDIMVTIFCALDLSLPDHCMFWAACNLAYFGFLRSAEFTAFCKGCFVHIGMDEFPLCAILSQLAYLSLWGNDPGPLFLFCNGQPLTHAILSLWLGDILAAVGIHGKFFSHSFCIGAATVAARNGIPDHKIQALGWQTSTAYLSYIRIPTDLLSQLSKQLVSSAAHGLLILA